MPSHISVRMLNRIRSTVGLLQAKGHPVTAPAVAKLAEISVSSAGEGLRRLGLAAPPGRPKRAEHCSETVARLLGERLGQEVADAYVGVRLGRGSRLSATVAVAWCSTAYRATATGYRYADDRAGALCPADMPRRVRA